MSDGRRPGGLTALAVINFVFGGLGAIGLLALFALLGAADTATQGEATKAMGAAPGIVWLNIILATASVALLIASGVGYLGQKLVLGRYMGNAYAISSIASTAVGLGATEQAFNIFTIVGLVYPVLTLILINTTFKEDLVN